MLTARSITDDEERLAQIEQLKILRGEIYLGNYDAAIEWIGGAIKILEREESFRHSREEI